MDRIRLIVRSWRDGTELSAARCMFQLAGLLEIDPPKAVAGKVRKRKPERMEAAELPSPNRHDLDQST